MDGTIHMIYKDQLIILKPKEKWANTTSGIVTQVYENGIAKANIIKTDKIINYGIIDKSKIEMW